MIAQAYFKAILNQNCYGVPVCNRELTLNNEAVVESQRFLCEKLPIVDIQIGLPQMDVTGKYLTFEKYLPILLRTSLNPKELQAVKERFNQRFFSD